MHNSRIKRISLAVCLALVPLATSAAGLGKLTVFSGLGEPLNAEIELSATKEELSSLSAKIAPAEVYAEQGLERPSVLGLLRVELAQPSSGKPIIKLVSSQPVEAPFLDMLIQLEWSNGRLLREYTALLDPPGYGESVTPAASVQVAPSVAAKVTASGQVRSSQRTGKTRKNAAPKAEAEPAPQGDEYVTRSGDTLRSVARQMQVEGVGLEQMLVGLYRANPDAFISGNMNRLKTGQIMRAPSGEEMQSLTQQEALKEIRIHTSDWNAYRNKLAGTVADTVPEDTSSQGQSSGGKITAPAEDKAAQQPVGPRDVVKLSKGDTSGKPAGPETPAGKEDAIAYTKAAQEAEARVAALEKQLQDMQKLLEIKSKELADLQKAASALATPAAPAVQPQPVPVPSEAVSATPPVSAEPAPAQEPKAEEPRKPKKPRRAPVAEPEPIPEPALLDDPLLLGGVGGGMIALLGGAWLYLRNKRRKGIDSFEQGILTTSGLRPNTVFGSTSGGLVDTGDTSFLTDISSGAGGMIDTNDVDPIAEAEVYMAYGRDVQAEEILKDAITRDPGRHELHQKLLEIYANRKDTAAFETLAGELYATLGASDPNWKKIAAIGFALEPENPLYQAEGAISASQAVAAMPQHEEPASFASELEMPLEFSPASDAGAVEPVPESPEAEGLDLDSGEPAIPVAESIVEPSSPESELAADSIAQPEEMEPPAVEAVEAGLDFSFELPEEASPDNVQLDADDLGMVALPDESPKDVVADETLPELVSIAEAAPEEISFELPELAAEEVPSNPEGNAQVTEEEERDIPLADATVENAEAVLAVPEIPEISLDFPMEVVVAESSMPELPAEETVSQAARLEVPELDAVDDNAVADTAPAADSGLDFNFDVDLGETESAAGIDERVAVGLPDLDLSGISLDLDESSPPPESEFAATASIYEMQVPVGEVEEISLNGEESADIDTKLDLVAAYLDMGDTEGARELLEEVLREGGEKQRERAQALLSSLG